MMSSQQAPLSVLLCEFNTCLGHAVSAIGITPKNEKVNTAGKFSTSDRCQGSAKRTPNELTQLTARLTLLLPPPSCIPDQELPSALSLAPCCWCQLTSRQCLPHPGPQILLYKPRERKYSAFDRHSPLTYLFTEGSKVHILTKNKCHLCIQVQGTITNTARRQATRYSLSVHCQHLSC